MTAKHGRVYLLFRSFLHLTGTSNDSEAVRNKQGKINPVSVLKIFGETGKNF
jgi:hypothetical protein